MNATKAATVEGVPDSQGRGFVTLDGVRRACYFDPLRFKSPWPVPAAGDRCLVTTGPTGPVALWLLGRGAPA